MRQSAISIFSIITALFAGVALVGSPAANAQDATKAPAVTLFKNVKVFNGIDGELKDLDVLVVKNKVHRVEADIPEAGTWEIDADQEARRVSPGFGSDYSGQYVFVIEGDDGEAKTVEVPVNIIDGGGRTLMPGLIESHVHVNLQHMIGGYDTVEHRDWQEIGAMGAFTAQSLLKDGWTTIRDPGASLTGIKTVIDRGGLAGPRMYQATAVISQTGGHGDFRIKGQRRLEDRYTFRGGELGMTHIVDGYDGTLSAVRQNLANGAAFAKMMMGGGIFSSKDPLHSRQSTDDEIKAVVEATAAWDTYTTAHIYLPEHAQRAIRLGLKEILHIPYLDKETAELMVEKGIFYNPQLSQSTPASLEAIFGPKESVNKAKARVTQKAMAQTVKILKEVPELLETTTFGVDIVTNTQENALRTRDHEMWFWADNFGNLATLKSMTSVGGKLAALTGKWNPYPDGPLGVIQEGAYADILLVDGNPLEDITVLGGSEKMWDAPARKAGEIPTMRLIMKDGVIYKNTL